MGRGLVVRRRSRRGRGRERRILLKKWLLAVWGRKGSGSHLDLNGSLVLSGALENCNVTRSVPRAKYYVILKISTFFCLLPPI